MKKTIARMTFGFACMMMPLIGKTALLTQYDPVVQSATIAIDIAMINNDASAIYNSGQLDLDALAGNVADAIIARNSAYSASSRNDVMSEWGVSIRTPPTGEVSTGWATILRDSNQLDIGHTSGGSYDTWNSTSDNPNQDMMELTVSVPKSQLDFNNNSLFDAETEAIFKTTESVAGAFTGVSNDGFSTWSASGNSYNVVPEPATMTMLGVAGLLIAAKRRFFG